MTPQKQRPQPLARGKRRCPGSPAWLKHFIKHFKISTTPPGGGWAYTRVAAGARALLGPLRPGPEASPRPCPAASSRAPRARPQPGLGEERPRPGGRGPGGICGEAAPGRPEQDPPQRERGRHAVRSLREHPSGCQHRCSPVPPALPTHLTPLSRLRFIWPLLQDAAVSVLSP